MSTLTIPVQTEQTLTGTYAKSGNDLYFISEEPDLFPPNPRTDWDCYSTFYIAPNRYFSGDKPVSAFVPDVKAGIGPEYVKLPIYAYVHSGIALSTTPFHDDFDSGLAGFAVCTRQNVADLGYSTPDWRSRAENVIKSELELYQQYLNGEAKLSLSINITPIPITGKKTIPAAAATTSNPIRIWLMSSFLTPLPSTTPILNPDQKTIKDI